jgi:catechol 2,3-dioxygenase-like lactoylglutathione lyase family enzyme
MLSGPLIRQIAPQFFTTEMAATLAYYNDKLGFDCVGTWDAPPVYAIVARDEHSIHFRLADPPQPNPSTRAPRANPRYS